LKQNDDDSTLESIERSWIKNYLDQIRFANSVFKLHNLKLNVERRWRSNDEYQYSPSSSSSLSLESDVKVGDMKEAES
jgi:hypothetical protein